MKEIVIKIDDGIYKLIMSMDKALATTAIRPRIFDAIRNGKVLPKGHGELKDVSKLPLDCGKYECGCDRICHCDDCIYATISLKAIKSVETLVEADKGVEE